MADETPKSAPQLPTAQPQTDTAPSTNATTSITNPDENSSQNVGGKFISVGIVLLAILLGAVVLRKTNLYPRTDDAEIFANFIGIAPVVNGPLTELDVHDNQQVHAGDLLFRIEDRPYRYTLDHANSDRVALEGQIEDERRRIRSQQSAVTAAAAGSRSSVANASRAEAAVAEAQAEVVHAQAALDTAQAEYTYAANNLRRIEPLLAKQFVTVDQVDQLRTGTATRQMAVQQAASQLAVTKASLAANQAALQAAHESISQSRAQEEQQQHAVFTLDPLTAQRSGRSAAVARAQYDFDQCAVRAPFDARVTDLVISQGAYAHAGEQMFTLVDTRVWWAIANFRETQLRHVLPGMYADVYLLGQPATPYRGIVDSVGYGVSPDATTIGTLRPGLPDVQRTLSWVHLASRYPVRIRILNPPPGVFRISQSADVVIRGWNGW